MSTAKIESSPPTTSTSSNMIKSSSIGNCPWGKPAAPSQPSPWAKVNAPAVAPCSLEDVMSEQLAMEMDHKGPVDDGQKMVAMQQQLLDQYAQSSSEAAGGADPVQSDAELAAQLAAAEVGGDPNDEAIARYLQREFDKEYDAMVDQVEKKYNGTSKVSISFQNYKMRHQRQEAGVELEEEEDDEDDVEYPEFPAATNWESPVPQIGSKGYSGQGKNIVTKHDKVICGRRNAERLMELPPEFASGDGEGMDMQLPNRVYNRLKAHSHHENRRGQKVHEKKEYSTAIKAVDQRTRILLFKLINSGHLTGIDGVVSEGKEAVIFKAAGGEINEKPLPPHVILKVFKTTMNEFRTRAKYVQGDHRLASTDKYKKQNPRKIMKLWAEKECMNLKRMRKQNIPSPTPIQLKKHVLVMTCIGGETPAPKLKMVKLSTEDMQDAYEQTIELMKRLYQNCGLVHADLSEYNLLWHDGKVWVIDVSQAVEKVHPNGNDFLLRDCQNISKFFKQAGVYGVGTAEELFMDVTQNSVRGEGKVFAVETQKYMKTEYPFDYYFEQCEGAVGEESSDSEDSAEEEEDGEADDQGSERLKMQEEDGAAPSKGEGTGSGTQPPSTKKTNKVSDNLTESEHKSSSTSSTKRWEISCDDDDGDDADVQ